MAVTIFSQNKVGNFFNKNFINVAVQMDSTGKDNEDIKRWYKDAKMIADTYKVDVYPTYLFFNQDGILVHTITGASDKANDFIEKAKDALDPKTQYSKLKEDFFEKDKRDSAFLLLLINSATTAGDDSALHTYINSYIASQKSLLTARNIELIARGTSKSSDKGFDVLLNYPKEVEAVIGKEKRIRILNTIAFDEEIFPVIMINGKKTVYGGGLSIYGGGTMNKHVDWPAIKRKIDLKYHNLSNQIIFQGKLKYYDWLEDWENFNALLLRYTSECNNIDTNLIDNMAGKLMQDCKDKKYFNDATKWSEVLGKNEKHPYYLQTYGRLLYKAGKKNAAIKYIKKYASLIKTSNESTNDLIERMKEGEEIE
ncbi:hypothetical protein GCM10023143_18150 [Compostibacter hankyongensis]|uniref:Thioredoxin family protein n=2 Tax=Compostibacter hankyongensis TaxID=1007089 RepID=A0ABP8FS75_9BACT